MTAKRTIKTMHRPKRGRAKFLTEVGRVIALLKILLILANKIARIVIGNANFNRLIISALLKESE